MSHPGSWASSRNINKMKAVLLDMLRGMSCGCSCANLHTVAWYAGGVLLTLLTYPTVLGCCCRQWTSKLDSGASGAGPDDGILEGILMLQVSSLFNSPKLVLWKRVDESVVHVVGVLNTWLGTCMQHNLFREKPRLPASKTIHCVISVRAHLCWVAGCCTWLLST